MSPAGLPELLDPITAVASDGVAAHSTGVRAEEHELIMVAACSASRETA
jgi:hypothetical protein